MPAIRSSLVALLILTALPASAVRAQSAVAESADAGVLRGTWYDADAGVRITFTPSSDGAVTGRIVWLRDPLDSLTGAPALDRRNPDAALRDRPILGLPMLRDMRPDGDGRWDDGRIYDARNGKTYRASMKLVHPDTLAIRGFVKIGFVKVGRTATWVRLPAEAAR